MVRGEADDALSPQQHDNARAQQLRCVSTPSTAQRVHVRTYARVCVCVRMCAVVCAAARTTTRRMQTSTQSHAFFHHSLRSSTVACFLNTVACASRFDVRSTSVSIWSPRSSALSVGAERQIR